MGIESVIATQVIDTTSVGRSVMTAANAAAALSAIGAQASLVSGTNIKTINSTSLLGSGDIAVSASPAGSSGQVQYNNSGAFGGMTAVVYAGTGTHVAITSQAAATIPLCVKGAASQSGDLTQWQNSSGSVLAKMDSGGVLTSGGANFSNNVNITNGSLIVTANTIYLGVYAVALMSASSGVLEINTGALGTRRDLLIRNLGLNGAVSAGGGVGIAFIANATTAPTTDPAGGGILYCESGALKFRGSSGTVTTLGPA